MFVEIVFRGGLPDEIDRDDIEDAITQALGHDGEVTGAGVGENTSNLDIESTKPVDAKVFLRTIAETLVRLGVGQITTLNTDLGESYGPQDLLH